MIKIIKVINNWLIIFLLKFLFKYIIIKIELIRLNIVLLVLIEIVVVLNDREIKFLYNLDII